MKNTRSKPSTRKATTPMKTLQTLLSGGLRRPFTNPTPVQDELARTWGPRHPVPATKQTRGI